MADIVDELTERGDALSLRAAAKITALRTRGKFWEKTAKKERAETFKEKQINIISPPCVKCKHFILERKFNASRKGLIYDGITKKCQSINQVKDFSCFENYDGPIKVCQSIKYVG